MHNGGTRKRGEKGDRTEKILKEIMAEMFPNIF